MLEKKTVSQCISSDYCKGWNDAVDAVGYPGTGWIPVKYHESCLQLEIRRRIAAEHTARQCIENYRPTTHGRWIHTTKEDSDWGGTFHRYTCSACNWSMGDNPAGWGLFCPHCGAKMDLEG